MQVDNEKDLDVVIPVYYLIDCSVNYAETLGRLWQYDKDDPNDSTTDFESFKFK